MLFNFSLEDSLHYFLKRESTQFFLSIAIRYLAMGMVGIFEPIYLYIHFNNSIAYVLFFWSAYSGIFALGCVFGGKIMAKLGLKRTMLLSHFFYFAYFICLFFIEAGFWIIGLAVFIRSIGAILFWPAFHTDFIRFTKGEKRARHVSKMSVVSLVAGIISPIIGGLILAGLGYMTLFTVVLVTLLASSFPLFLSKERFEIYTDDYKKAWQRILKNRDTTFALFSLGVEAGTDFIIWPLFIFILGINYEVMGGISTVSFLIAALFALYMGRITSKRNKAKLLNIGSILLSIAWLLKILVRNTISAFLGQNFYRICKTYALIPFRTTLYDKAAAKKAEADEFIIYREMAIHISRFFYFFVLGLLFLFFLNKGIEELNMLRATFILAMIGALGFSFLSKPRPFSFNKIIKIKLNK
jgi:MFS family permease